MVDERRREPHSSKVRLLLRTPSGGCGFDERVQHVQALSNRPLLLLVVVGLRATEIGLCPCPWQKSFCGEDKIY